MMMKTTKDPIKDAQHAVEAAERALKACQEWLSSLEAEQEEQGERLEREALLAAEAPGEGEAALEQALLRRQALPYLQWAGKVRMMRLQIEHKDARIQLLDLRMEKVREELHRTPADKALQKQLEDLDLERRQTSINDGYLSRELKRLEETAPGA